MRLILAILLVSSFALTHAAEPLGSNAFIPEEMPRTGFFKDVFKDPDTEKDLIRFCINCPDKLPDRRTMILLVYFHGCGGNEESFKWRQYLAERGIKFPNTIWLGLKSAGRCWAGSDHDGVTKILDWMIKTYPVDERRIFTRGFSSGAFLQKTYSPKHHQRIAGAIQFGGGGKVGKFIDDPANKGLEFYMSVGEADKFYQSGCIPAAESMEAAGIRFLLRPVIGYGHGGVLDGNSAINQHISDDITQWMYALRHKTRGLYQEDLALLKKVNKMDVEDVWKDKLLVDEMIRIGGHECTSFIMSNFKSKDKQNIINAIKFCGKVNVSAATTTQIARYFLKDKDAEIRQEAGSVLNRLLNWRHKTAQMAIIEKIKGKKSEEKDVLQAIAGIKTYIDYQAYGSWRNDPHVYQGLVLALNNESKAVRSAAFAALKKANKDDGRGYDPNLDKKERKEGLRSWENWLGLTFDKSGKKRK